MTVRVPTDWLDIDELLSMLSFFHFADLELLTSVIFSNGRAPLATLTVYDGLVGARDQGCSCSVSWSFYFHYRLFSSHTFPISLLFCLIDLGFC